MGRTMLTNNVSTEATIKESRAAKEQLVNTRSNQNGRSTVLETPAQMFVQGQRTVFQFALTVEQFDDVMPEEVEIDVISDHNRRFTPKHSEGIEDYLRLTDEWVLGPITICAATEWVQFEPFDGQDRDLVPAVGLLRILQGSRAHLKILDGQHRRWAIRNYRTKPADSADERERQTRFEKSQLPVALYVERDPTRISQMFADMAQQRNMDAITKALFNVRDPFTPAAAEVMAESHWIGPFIEMNQPNVKRSSDKLLAFNQLVDNLKTLKYGYYRWPKRIPFDSEIEEYDKIVEDGLRWTDEFLLDARFEYAQLSDDGYELGFLLSMRPESLAYGATMLRIMAGSWHEWSIKFPSRNHDALAKFIDGLDCQPRATSGFWVDTGVLAPGKASLTAKIADVRNTVNELVRCASTDVGPLR